MNIIKVFPKILIQKVGEMAKFENFIVENGYYLAGRLRNLLGKDWLHPRDFEAEHPLTR